MEFDSVSKKIIKYLTLFIIIYLACMYVPKNMLQTDEIVIISSIGTSAYAFMEIYYPGLKIVKNNN